jgi:hypothetical protein
MDFPHQVEIVKFLVDKLREHSRPCVLLNESTTNTEEPNEQICFHSALGIPKRQVILYTVGYEYDFAYGDDILCWL